MSEPSPETLRTQIERWRDNVLDLDIVVDDRRELDAAIDAYRAAVRDRDHAARHLANLMTETLTDSGDDVP